MKFFVSGEMTGHFKFELEADSESEVRAKLTKKMRELGFRLNKTSSDVYFDPNIFNCLLQRVDDENSTEQILTLYGD